MLTLNGDFLAILEGIGVGLYLGLLSTLIGLAISYAYAKEKSDRTDHLKRVYIGWSMLVGFIGLIAFVVKMA